MSHEICALVIAGPVDAQKAHSVGLRAELVHEGVSVFPVNHYFSSYWAAKRGNSALLDLPDGLSLLFPTEAVLRDLVREVTGRTGHGSRSSRRTTSAGPVIRALSRSTARTG